MRTLRLVLGLAWAARALDDACVEGEHDVRLRPSRLDDGGATVMEFATDDLRTFVRDVWDDGLAGNTGGMGAPDLFTLYVALKTLRPKVVVESGVFNGISTRLIRRVLPEATIICLDPRAIDAFGYVDANERTTYHIARDFVDFEKLDLSAYNRDEVLVFFDDHQDAYDRVLQSAAKGITDVFFNDNYPLDSGGHYTLDHLLRGDTRHRNLSEAERSEVIDLLIVYRVFPNIYPGDIKTMDGVFGCESFFKEGETDDELAIFKEDRNRYRWNTYVKLKGR